jgi:hypothetical membrane protein
MGVATPIIAFTCIAAAILSYPTFSWTNNALSDLGVVTGITGPLFNSGLVVAGGLGFCFATLGLFGYFEKPLGKAGAVMFATGTVALIAIGIFNEHYSPTHYIVSVAFFTLMPIAMFILTCAFAAAHQTKMAAFTVLIGLAAALPWILQLTLHYVSNVAIPEAISGTLIATWTIVLSYKILKQPNQPPKNP